MSIECFFFFFLGWGVIHNIILLPNIYRNLVPLLSRIKMMNISRQEKLKDRIFTNSVATEIVVWCSLLYLRIKISGIDVSKY